MTWMMCRPAAASIILPLMFGAGLVASCGALDVSDPTRVEDDELNNAAGADLMRKGALLWMAAAVSVGAAHGGMLADEFLADPNAASVSTYLDGILDRRESQQYEDLGSSYGYTFWHNTRRSTTTALPRLRTYMPEPARSAYIGQMLAVRGFAALRLAEDFCPGFPLNDIVDLQIVYDQPRSTVEVFEQALADLDSAVVFAADSARFLNLARVGRARALLGLGRFADAATAVGPVPTSYIWHAEFGTTGPFNGPLVFTWSLSNSRWSVADREGGTGLDYVSAKDPRVMTDSLGMAYDGVTEVRAIGKYPTQLTPMVVASGIEARLIEAEAALQANPNDLQWLTILNTLRTTGTQTSGTYDAGTGGVAGLSPLTDPGTDAARVDLLFRERGFWLFATGHRLADLRRLIEHYGRAPETVFPSGSYRLGGQYGAATNIPFPAAEEAANNRSVTGCTSR